MGAAAPIMMIGQTLMKTAAINKQAHQQADMYKNQAQLEKNKAAMQRVMASQAADRSANEERKILNKARAVTGRNAAAAGASGLMQEGSLADVNNASNDEAVFDLKNSLFNQRNVTWQHRTNELYNNLNASNYMTAARNVKQEARAQIASTILGAAASAYSSGMFGGGGNGNESIGSQWSYSAGKTPLGYEPMEMQFDSFSDWANGKKPKKYTSWG